MLTAKKGHVLLLARKRQKRSDAFDLVELVSAWVLGHSRCEAKTGGENDVRYYVTQGKEEMAVEFAKYHLITTDGRAEFDPEGNQDPN